MLRPQRANIWFHQSHLCVTRACIVVNTNYSWQDVFMQRVASDQIQGSMLLANLICKTEKKGSTSRWFCTYQWMNGALKTAHIWRIMKYWNVWMMSKVMHILWPPWRMILPEQQFGSICNVSQFAFDWFFLIFPIAFLSFLLFSIGFWSFLFFLQLPCVETERK